MININELTDSKGRVIGLDLVRFFAIFYVFWGHGILLIPNEYKQVYSLATFLPIEGVSTFFVLSGFLIGNILYKTLFKTNFETSDIINFWKRRWYRTLPNYYFVLLILLLLGASSENFNFSFIFFTQSFIGSHPDFFGVTWSLAVEEWFYFLFPLLLFFLFKVSKNKNTTLVISIFFFLLLPMILRHLKYHDFNFLAEAHYRKTTIFRFDSLMFGVITSVIYS